MNEPITHYLKSRTNPNLCVYHCGHHKCDSGHAFGPFIRDHYLIHCVVKGCGTYTTKEKTYKIHAGEGFLIMPNETTTYQADLSDPWEYYWVGFNGSDAKRIVGMCGLSKNNLSFKMTDFETTMDYLKRIYNVWENTQSKEYAMLGYLYLFLSSIMSAQKEDLSANIYLEKALSIIDQQYPYEITVAKIADIIGIDRSYLYKLFMVHLKISPKEYLLAKRIEKAKELLTGSSLTLSQICYSVGFTEYSHFSKIFKKVCGVSPKDYAKTL